MDSMSFEQRKPLKVNWLLLQNCFSIWYSRMLTHATNKHHGNIMTGIMFRLHTQLETTQNHNITRQFLRAQCRVDKSQVSLAATPLSVRTNRTILTRRFMNRHKARIKITFNNVWWNFEQILITDNHGNRKVRAIKIWMLPRLIVICFHSSLNQIPLITYSNRLLERGWNIRNIIPKWSSIIRN